jgi:hypothetical protein
MVGASWEGKMLFHSLVDKVVPDKSAFGGNLAAIETAVTRPKKKVSERVNKTVLIGALASIAFFGIAALVAHLIAFPAGASTFLNLTLVWSSACIGAFLGEKVAIKDLLQHGE